MDWIKIFESTSDAEKVLTENKPKLLRVNGRSICLVKQNGKIFAVQNNCTHSEGSLHLGKVNLLGDLVCPLHQHQYNLKTGREVDQRSADLESFPICESEEGIFIGI
ncbi:MAG: Rieske 2Fe-2S domain-containing protein [Bacteroidetes bacterium]|nr:Rieske 2Fe-2S domain-containing protein [Bacteroidota bacterium]MBI3481788.1 Rieske 2Fe-2S domain-containing protein [Bacteroidota bacterium]